MISHERELLCLAFCKTAPSYVFHWRMVTTVGTWELTNQIFFFFFNIEDLMIHLIETECDKG